MGKWVKEGVLGGFSRAIDLQKFSDLASMFEIEWVKCVRERLQAGIDAEKLCFSPPVCMVFVCEFGPLPVPHAPPPRPKCSYHVGSAVNPWQ